jgi:hypothetical protein
MQLNVISDYRMRIADLRIMIRDVVEIITVWHQSCKLLYFLRQKNTARGTHKSVFKIR